MAWSQGWADLADCCHLTDFQRNDWTFVTDSALTVEKDSVAGSTRPGRQGLGVWYPCGMEDELLVQTGEKDPSSPSLVRDAEVRSSGFLSPEGH